jgi:hypothetical protein
MDRAHRDTERRVKQELAEWLERARESFAEADDPVLATLMVGLGAAEGLVRERTSQRESTESEFGAREAALDAEWVGLEDEKKGLEGERNQGQILVEDRAQAHARTTEELKRVEIQLQAANDAAREAAGAGARFAPPEHARRISDLEQRRTALAAAAAESERALGAARADLRARERAVRACESRIRELDERKRALLRDAQHAQGLRSEGVDRAEEHRLTAVDAIWQHVLGEGAAPGLCDGERRARVESLYARLRASATDLERHRLAVDAYDPDAFKKGVVVWLLGAVLVVGLLFLIARVR